MEGSEQVSAIIEGLSSADFPFYDYNLVVTTRRIVLIRIRSLRYPELGLAKGGLWGWTVDGKTLDELLQKDEKSYAINDEEITGIKLHKGLVNSKLIVESKGSQKIFLFNNYKKIYSMLLQAPALAGSFHFKIGRAIIFI